MLLAISALALGLMSLIQPDPGNIAGSMARQSFGQDDPFGNAISTAKLQMPQLGNVDVANQNCPTLKTAIQAQRSKELRESDATDEESTPSTPSSHNLICNHDGSSFQLQLQESDGKIIAEVEKSIPTWVALIPPVLAVVWAFLLQNALLALFSGVLLGGFILAGFDPVVAFELTFVDYIGGTLKSRDNQLILVFTSTLVAMVQICIATGGINAFVDWITRGNATRRRTQATTVALGGLIFFDDYANTTVVGSSMRPMADKSETSREKLAYLVDATSAPIAGIALVSTWIAYEIGMFDNFGSNNLQQYFGDDVTNGFSVFLHAMPFRFYCILTLFFVVSLVWSRRDFGPMLQAERKAKNSARENPELANPEASPPKAPGQRKARAIDGIGPIIVTLAAIVGWFTYVALTHEVDPEHAHLPPLVQAMNAASGRMLHILTYCGLFGSLLALLWATIRVRYPVRRAIAAYVHGVRFLAPTLAILVLAITMKTVTEELGTGPFLGALVQGAPTVLLPVIVFALAGFVAFATGSSWATMGVLVPVAIETAASLGASHSLMLATAASVLDGAIFGDHCSPISDTTVLSSASTGCNHLAHVRTQLPYALIVGITAMVFGYGLSTAITGDPWLGYVTGSVALFAIIMRFGKHP